MDIVSLIIILLVAAFLVYEGKEAFSGLIVMRKTVEDIKKNKENVQICKDYMHIVFAYVVFAVLMVVLEVAGGVIDGIGLGTGKIQKGPGKEEGQGGQKQGSHCDQQQGLPQRAVGAFPVVFAPAAGDHGGDAHIQGHEKGQHDKAGLVRQPYRRDGSRTFYAHHDGVCQADQGDEERFAHGRPGDAEQIAQRFFGVGQRLPHPVFFFDEDLWVKKTVHDFWQSLRNDAPPGIAERRRHEGRPTGRETKISIARSTTLGK